MRKTKPTDENVVPIGPADPPPPDTPTGNRAGDALPGTDAEPATTMPVGNGETPPTPQPGSAPDRRAKLRSMRISQVTESVAGPRVLTYVPCQKPPPKSFVRCHPSPDYSALYYCLLEGASEGDRESYIVDDDVAHLFGKNVRQVRLTTTVTALGSTFLWPLKMPSGGRTQTESWSQSALDLAERAKTQWLRIGSDMELRAYVGEPATADFGEPRWPTEDFDTILSLAFPDANVIDSPLHPAVRRFLGLERH